MNSSERNQHRPILRVVHKEFTPYRSFKDFGSEEPLLAVAHGTENPEDEQTILNPRDAVIISAMKSLGMQHRNTKTHDGTMHTMVFRIPQSIITSETAPAQFLDEMRAKLDRKLPFDVVVEFLDAEDDDRILKILVSFPRRDLFYDPDAACCVGTSPADATRLNNVIQYLDAAYHADAGELPGNQENLVATFMVENPPNTEEFIRILRTGVFQNTGIAVEIEHYN